MNQLLVTQVDENTGTVILKGVLSNGAEATLQLTGGSMVPRLKKGDTLEFKVIPSKRS